MSEIIRKHSVSYARYEELISRRDELKKQAFQFHKEYVREFGDLILSVFEKKIACIRKKKTIEYCTAALNRGQDVDQSLLQMFLKKEMEEFESQFRDMQNERESAIKARNITEKELLFIKRIYHRLVKKIHPDINPAITSSHVLMDLWQRVSSCYACNDLKGLEELEVLVVQALESADLEDLEIPNIDVRIAELEEEIKNILETDPYQYKFLLDDPQAVKEKKEDLEAELATYEDYGKELDKALEDVLGKGVRITWQMNLQ